MDLIDSKYVGLISSRLQKFKKVKPDLYNFRCPICGDSQKNKNKCRGYMYVMKNNTNFKCHNCGASLSLNNFIKKLDTTLHRQYTIEKFKEGHTGRNFTAEEPVFNFKKPVFKKKLDLPKASEDPVANKYLVERKLNPIGFISLTVLRSGQIVKSKRLTPHIGMNHVSLYQCTIETRISLDFRGRSLIPNSVKYITVMLNDHSPKLYGLDNVDEKQPIYIVEGPFDSTFVENAVAMCGSDVDIRSFDWSDHIWVLDNEPRNREIVNRIAKLIDRGEKVVIWGNNIVEKDINDMVLAGHDVMSMIKLNTYAGLEAKIKFNTWKKV